MGSLTLHTREKSIGHLARHRDVHLYIDLKYNVTHVGLKLKEMDPEELDRKHLTVRTGARILDPVYSHCSHWVTEEI